MEVFSVGTSPGWMCKRIPNHLAKMFMDLALLQKPKHLSAETLGYFFSSLSYLQRQRKLKLNINSATRSPEEEEQVHIPQVSTADSG